MLMSRNSVIVLILFSIVGCNQNGSIHATIEKATKKNVEDIFAGDASKVFQCNPSTLKVSGFEYETGALSMRWDTPPDLISDFEVESCSVYEPDTCSSKLLFRCMGRNECEVIDLTTGVNIHAGSYSIETQDSGKVHYDFSGINFPVEETEALKIRAYQRRNCTGDWAAAPNCQTDANTGVVSCTS